jgi:hemerythrin
MEHSIEFLMKKEHEKINELINKFKNSLNKDFKNSKEAFNSFKWNLEKHFFAEEKAIFSALVSEQEVDDIFELIKEHQKIMEQVNNIEDDLDENKKPDVSILNEILTKHALYENDVFYPKLDELLSTAQKQEIIERAKEVILK